MARDIWHWPIAARYWVLRKRPTLGVSIVGPFTFKSLQKDKLEPVSSKEIPELIKAASKLSTYEADQKISLHKVENAKASCKSIQRINLNSETIT